MAMFVANLLTVLAKVASNGVSTFTFFGFWDEEECPEEML
jgi:hypothetical protein